MTIPAVSLVKPPPKLATPDDATVLPAVQGAGASTPAPGATPQPLEGVTALPFGNGVTPVLQSAGPIGTDVVDNTGFQQYTGLPMNTVSMPSSGLPAPVGDPMTSPATASGLPSDGNLSGTLIAPPAGGTPAAPDPNAVADQYAQKFGADLSSPAIQAGALDPRVSASNGRLDAAVSDLGSTDRTSMLNTLLSDFDKQQAAKDDASYTAAGQKAAALGRIGSGMTSQDIDQIARQSMGDKQIFRNQLASDTIDKEIADKFGKVSALGGVANDAYGQASSDRGFNYGVASDNRTAATQGKLNAYNLAGTYADRSAATAATNRANALSDRNELRGERSYQDTTAQTAIDRQVQQQQVQEALTQGDFNRALQLLQQGNTGSPAAAYAGAASDLSGQSSNTAQLLSQFLNSIGYGSGQKAA